MKNKNSELLFEQVFEEVDTEKIVELGGAAPDCRLLAITCAHDSIFPCGFDPNPASCVLWEKYCSK